MSRLTRRVALKPRQTGGGGKTYAEFQAHIATKATNGAVVWTNAIFNGGRLRSIPTVTSGVMYGSPWQSFYARMGSAFCRVIQHSMASQAAFDAVVSGGYEVYLEDTASWGSGDAAGAARNGYTSLDGTDIVRGRPTLVLYWDGSRAMQVNPSAGTGPQPYDW